tara:strand:+ start:1628 stop:1792 length:165 start_codon:yes stop_codon:yes gene_type:complete
MSMSVIIYQDHIEILEEENLLLRREVLFLKEQLGYKSLGFPSDSHDNDINNSKN